MRHLDIDAFPDTTPVQVQINTVAPALGPEEVEQQITFPIEQALGGLPGLETVRSISKFGLSQVVVIFEDGTDIYFARQLVNERLAQRRSCRTASSGRRWGRSRPGWARSFTTSSPATSDDVTELRTHARLGHPAEAAHGARASPRSTPGAATRSSTRSASIPTSSSSTA